MHKTSRWNIRVRWAGAILGVGLLWCEGAFAAEPRAILLRGLFGVFSTGMDGLANELRAEGVDAEAAMYWYWGTAVSDILRERAAGKVRPLVLVGHSQGANNSIELARRLEEAGVPVDLLVTLAPVTPGTIPANVARAVNYYQSPGWGSSLVPGPGFRGKILNNNLGDDWTVYHITLDKTTRIRSAILREVQSLSRAKRTGDRIALSSADVLAQDDRLAEMAVQREGNAQLNRNRPSMPIPR